MTTNSPSGLIYKETPVPWVARWSEEIDNTPVTYGPHGLHYTDGRENRELGVLWLREHNDRQGQGTPRFGDVSTTRQREAMLSRLCQVCGDECRVPGPWLIAGLETKLSRPRGGSLKTTTPPICEICLPIALANCPDLKTFAPTLLTVYNYRPWGFTGEIVDAKGHRPTEVGTGFHNLGAVLARQLTVEIFNYRVVRPAQ